MSGSNLDSKLESLPKEELIRLVKKQAQKLKNSQGASSSQESSGSKKGAEGLEKSTTNAEVGDHNNQASISASNVPQLLAQIESYVVEKEALQKELSATQTEVASLKRINEDLKHESECMSMQKATFMDSMQLLESEKKKLANDLQLMTAARDEALKLVENAKASMGSQKKNKTQAKIEEYVSERDGLLQEMKRLSKDMDYEKALMLDEKEMWAREKQQLEQDLKHMTEKVQTLEKENSEFQKQIEDNQNQIQSLQEQLSSAYETVRLREDELVELKSSDGAVNDGSAIRGREMDEKDGLELEALHAQVNDLKRQLATVNDERAKLSEALKLTNQAKEEVKLAMENEKQLLSECNFNLQATNTYLTSKVLTMSRQLESIPEEQRSSQEEEISVETIPSDDATSHVQTAVSGSNSANDSPAANLEVADVEHRLLSINLVLAQLQKEKESLLAGSSDWSKQTQLQGGESEEASTSNEPDLVASCSQAIADASENAIVVKCEQCSQITSSLSEMQNERDCLVDEVETLRNHELDLIKSQSSLEARLEELTNEKESICKEVQGLIEDLDKYVQQNSKLQEEKDQLATSVAELSSSAELVSALQDTHKADKVLLAEKDQQISILEDEVSILQDSVGQYKSRMTELESTFTSFEDKFSAMEKSSEELKHEKLGEEQSKLKMSEELEICREAMFKLQDELDTHKGLNEDLREKIEERTGQIKNLELKIEQLEVENGNLFEKLNRVRPEEDASNDASSEESKKFDDKKEGNNAPDVISQSAESQECQTELDVEAMHRELSEKVAQLEVLQDENVNLSSRVAELEKDVETRIEAIESTRKELESQNKIIEESGAKFESERNQLTASYESQLKSVQEKFESDIANLNNELSNLRLDVEAKQSELLQNQQVITEKTDLIETLKKEFEDKSSVEEVRTKLTAEIESLELKLTDAANKLGEQMSEKSRLQESIENMNKEVVNKSETLVCLTNELESLKLENTELTKQLQTNNEAYEQSKSSLNVEINQLKSSLDYKNQVISDLSQEKQKFEAQMINELDSVAQERDASISSLAQCREQLEVLENSNVELNDQNAALQDDLANSEHTVSNLRETIVNLESTMAELELQYERVRDQNSDLSEKLTEALDRESHEKLSLAKELEDLKSSALTRESSFSELKTEHSDCFDRIEKLEADLELVRKEKNKLEDKMQGSGSENLKELQTCQAQIVVLESEVEELKEQKRKVYEMYKKVEEQLGEKAGLLEDVQNKNMVLEQDLQHLSSDKESLQKSNKWYSENIEDFKAQLQEVKRENSSLREKLSESQTEKIEFEKEYDNMKFQFAAFQESDGRLRSQVAELEKSKVEWTHKYNLLVQEVERFLNAFNDETCAVLNLECPDVSLTLADKMKFIDEDVKKALFQFASSSKELHQQLLTTEKKLSSICQCLNSLVLEVANGSLGDSETVVEPKQQMDLVLTHWKGLLNEKQELVNQVDAVQEDMERRIKQAETAGVNEESWLKEKQALEEKCTETDTKNQKLKQLALKSKKEIQSLKTKVEEVTQKHDQVLSEVQVKIDRISQLETSLQQLQTQYDDLCVKCDQSTLEKGALEESLESARKQLEALVEEKTLIQSNSSEFSGQMETLRKQKEECETSLSVAEDKLRSLQARIAQVEEEKNNLEDVRKREEGVYLDQIEALKRDKESEVQKWQQSVTEAKAKYENELEELREKCRQGTEDKTAMLDLEMADMRRSLEVLQEKVNASNSLLDTTNAELNAATNQKDHVLKEKKEIEEKNAKMKQLLLKQKKELEELRKSETALKSKLDDASTETTNCQSEIEKLKIQLANAAQGSVSQSEQVASLERRNAGLAELCDSLKAEVETLEAKLRSSELEFEQYKTRVHTVLKQQKEKTQNVDAIKTVTAERDGLRGQLQSLRAKVDELVRDLDTVQLDKERLQRESSSLSSANAHLSQQLATKEQQHKQKLDEVRFEWEKSRNAMEVMESGYKGQITNLTQYYKEKLATEQKEFNEKIEHLKSQLHKEKLMAEDKIVEETLTVTTSLPQYAENSSVISSDGTIKAVGRHSLGGKRAPPIGMERSEGDGVESFEVVTRGGGGRNASQGREFVSFEQLLSPSPTAANNNTYLYNVPLVSSDSNSTHQRTPSESSSVSLSTPMRVSEQQQQKKVAHLTELLNESELNNQRMSDQVKVLKDEIRRLEGSWDETAKNMEYLKNILMKFLKLPGGSEKEQLVPVLTMLLKLNQDEKAAIMDLSMGDETSQSSVPSATGWSSYMPKWSGLM